MHFSCPVGIGICCGAIAAQTTWIVDAAGGGHFTDIPPAIAAASPGDHIEVRGTATYSAFVVDRGVDIFTRSRAATPTIEVIGVPAGQHARVTGFDVPLRGGVVAVAVRLCAGSVLLADLQEVGVASMMATAYPGLVITDSRRVFVDGGSFAGQHAYGGGKPGLFLVRANATVVGATFRGGTVVSPSINVGSSGAPGIQIAFGCHLLLDGVTAIGGSATSGWIVGGDGGDALSVAQGAFAVAVGQCQFQGTAGGSGGGQNGLPGAAIDGDAHYTLDCILNGPVVSATSIPNRPVLRTAASVALGSSLDLDVQGDPAQVVLLMFDLTHDHIPSVAYDSALVVTPQAAVAGLLTLDAGGRARFGVPVPANPLLRHLDVFCQGAADVAGAPVLLAPTHARTQ